MKGEFEFIVEKFSYVISHHFATGEGSTILMMIVPNHYDVDLMFNQFFDSYYQGSSKIVTEEEFLEYIDYIPVLVQRIIRAEVPTPGNFIWYSSFHVNY